VNVPIQIYDVATGDPLAGVTPAILYYKRRNANGSISNLADPTLDPSDADGITELEIDDDDLTDGSVISYALDLGVNAADRYFLGHAAADEAERVVCFFVLSEATGAPASGIAADLEYLTRRNEDGSHDDLMGSAPVVTDHGNLLYSFEVEEADLPAGSTIRYRLDLTASSLARYEHGEIGAFGGSTDDTLPTVENVTPADGTEISADDPIGFDVVDAGGNLLLSNVFAYYPALGVFEVVWFAAITGSWGSRAAGFAPRYQGTREAIANGFRFSDVIRTGGWPAAPVIVTDAADAAGNENA
jgi:hypothetical protein